jgi:hypothetical protein
MPNLTIFQKKVKSAKKKKTLMIVLPKRNAQHRLFALKLSFFDVEIVFLIVQ